MVKLPSVSVIIPTLNVSWCIEVQLNALAKQRYEGGWELIVVDNGSTDQTTEIVDSYVSDFPVPIIIVSATDIPGSSHARNVGIKEASSQLLCFCDADDRVEENWISELVSTYRIGSIIAGTNRSWNGLDTPNLKKGWCSATSPHLGGPPIAMGCNMLISKEDASSIGGFDPGFITGQDAEFSWRFQSAGGNVLSSKGAVIDYRDRCGISKNFSRHFQYGLDDIKLMQRYSTTFKYDRKTLTHPRMKPPINRTIAGIQIRKSGGLLHIARTWGKYLGHLVGRARFFYFK